MVEYLTISKQKPQFPAYLDFQVLRQIGITRLTELAGKIWTDYNLHDPGITILEVLCYAITDLGYRNNLDIEDLLALKPGASENNFFTPDQILTCNPVTLLDIRKRLIDIQGIHNAWLEKVESYYPPIWIDQANNKLCSAPPPDKADELVPLNPRGLYRVYLDLDPDYHKNACGQLYRSWSDVLDEVKQVLSRYRNLCEDIHDIVVLGEEEIRVCADIQLEAEANGEDVLVNIYGEIQNFLVPPIHFYTLQQLLDKNYSIAKIFAGRPAREDLGEVYRSHGFIDTQELEHLTLPEIIHTSDIYQNILSVPGIAAIKGLLIASLINGLPQTQENPWYLQLTPHHRPVLSIEGSTIRLFKNGLPIPVNLDEVKRRYYEQRSAYIKTRRDPYELDLMVPKGKYADTLSNHYSIHHDFPVTYGISEEGIPKPVSAKREAQAKQLKGYLVFFDQLLANYLSQLSHVRDLFSWEADATQTYFNQSIQFPGWEEILPDQSPESVREEPEIFRDRRNRFLDHLLARFGESFTDYVLLNYKIFENHQDKVEHETHWIQEKANFLKNYPVLSRDRFRAFNYSDCNAVWSTKPNVSEFQPNVSGFKKRVSRLLGIENAQQRNLNHYNVKPDPVGFTVSIHGGSPEQTLTSKQVYPTQEAAQAGLEKFLSFALCANYYRRLTYQYFYHYGWEIELMDEGEPIQARSEAYFVSQIDRLNALQSLLQDWSAAVIPIAIQPDGPDLYYFQFDIRPRAAQVRNLKFTGVQRYFSEEIARAKATAIVQQIRELQTQPEILFEILYLTNGGAERETENPSPEARFTHYGYALVDHEGTLLAESDQRLWKSQERDAELKRWLSTIRAGNCAEVKPIPPQTGTSRSAVTLSQAQFGFAIQPTEEKYYFVLQDAVQSPILRSLNSYTDIDKAWEAAYAFAENLFYLNRYVNPAPNQTGITNGQGELLALSDTEGNPLELFKQLNSVEPFLSTQMVQAETDTGTVVRHRAQLSDRSGTILLETTQLFEDADTARDRFYQEVLGVLFEPGLRYSSTEREGFGLGVLSRPNDRNSKVAVHPKIYATEQERDAAVNRLFLLVRTAQVNMTINRQDPAFIGLIHGQDGSILLQGVQRYASEDEGWVNGNTLVELASIEAELDQRKPDGKNFRLIDTEDAAQDLYGWELTNSGKDQILATHFYNSKRDRNTAITTLQQHVNDEGFHVVEHILLRPRETDASESFLPIYVEPDETIPTDGSIFTIARRDPYSFWISIVLPYWSERFRDINFRRFVEQTLRLEAPAHVALKIAWVDLRQMDQFETAYRNWLEQLAQSACEGTACNLVGSQKEFIEILTHLSSVYPEGTLVSTQVSRSQSNPITLNQTALGGAR